MHPLFWLAFATFALVVAFLIWNQVSTGRHRFGRKAEGVGGPSDPIAGATDNLRDPDTMRASLDEAASKPLSERASPPR
ncbi:MAG: hypothetical protein JOZ42_15405 [Acetobacteraceae bacterium]|nr:hypothetical protein [Acetobacteraceae bacterium]